MKKKILLILLFIFIFLSFNNNNLENFYVTPSTSESSTTESKLAEKKINDYETSVKNEKKLNEDVKDLTEEVAKLEGEIEILKNPPEDI